MKIILKPTSKDEAYHTVSIERISDDLRFEEVMSLMQSALVAWGFNVETVREYFKSE